MAKPDVLTELHASHLRLLGNLEHVSDAELRGPSALPGWPRDVLVSHIWHGAAAQQRGIEGALSAAAGAMYTGGDAQREAEIASGAGLPAAELRTELAAACTRFEELFAGLPDGVADAPVQTRSGVVPVREMLFRRWTEVEVHHADLDIGYRPGDWPAAFVDAALPRAVAILPQLRGRADADLELAGSWHLHRTDAPGEWTLHAVGAVARLDEGHAKGDCALRGAGRDLLAFLFGRCGADVLEVLGDAAKAVGLKRAFPGP